jgi:hypothetical protein
MGSFGGVRTVWFETVALDSKHGSRYIRLHPPLGPVARRDFKKMVKVELKPEKTE